MSKRREVTAVRVANVPAEDFEALVESEHPPTVTALAEMGKASAPAGFVHATRALGTLGQFAAFCQEHQADFIAGAIYDRVRASTNLSARTAATVSAARASARTSMLGCPRRARDEDDTLHRLATRISARAIRRAGELLKTFDARGGDRTKSADADTSARPSQREAADQAGMSKRREVTAVRVANVPADDFDNMSSVRLHLSP